MIESAYKNYNCCSFPEFSNFPGNFPSFFFLNLIRTITNILKKELAKSVQASQVMRLTKNIISFSNFPIFCAIFLIFHSVRTFYEVLENIKKKDE
jgi:hypothetical protein